MVLINSIMRQYLWIFGPPHYQHNKVKCSVYDYLTTIKALYHWNRWDFLKKCNAIQTLLQHPHGLILITGATGSGKSTTLYTLLKTMQKQHVITLEDP